MRSIATSTACALLALSFATPAWAVDGERLITQADAKHGSVTPGDAPGFPVTISRSGSYKLASDLLVAKDRDGIQVTRSNVTIDLNGWTIDGRGVGKYGIAALNSVNIVSIRNGTIRGFKKSTVFGGGFGWAVDHVTVTDIQAGDGLLVSQSTVGAVACGDACNISTSHIGAKVTLHTGIVSRNVIRHPSTQVGIASTETKADSVGFGDNVLVEFYDDTGPQVQTPAVAPLTSNHCDPQC